MAISISEKIKAIIRLVAEPKTLSALLSLRVFGFFYDEGWFEAFKLQQPVDKKLKPIPWVTYSFLDFIKVRLTKKLDVFEFGSGNSTLFFADKVNCVTSVEHSYAWYNKLKDRIPDNVKLKCVNKEVESYIGSLKEENKKFDIIIIDGVYRTECCLNATAYLTEQGVIILDDSERQEYREGIDFLLRNGLKKIDFAGIAPGILFNKCTTIFYRSSNCLGI